MFWNTHILIYRCCFSITSACRFAQVPEMAQHAAFMRAMSRYIQPLGRKATSHGSSNGEISMPKTGGTRKRMGSCHNFAMASSGNCFD